MRYGNTDHTDNGRRGIGSHCVSSGREQTYKCVCLPSSKVTVTFGPSEAESRLFCILWTLPMLRFVFRCLRLLWPPYNVRMYAFSGAYFIAVCTRIVKKTVACDYEANRTGKSHCRVFPTLSGHNATHKTSITRLKAYGSRYVCLGPITKQSAEAVLRQTAGNHGKLRYKSGFARYSPSFMPDRVSRQHRQAK